MAAGEAVPNRVIFKNLLQADAIGIVQVDVARVGGVSEFLAISLLARRFGKPVVPHVGDMGQIHQHLVLANRIVPELEAAAEPPLEPPAECSRDQGFLVGGWIAGSVTGMVPNSEVASLPRMTNPARRKGATV